MSNRWIAGRLGLSEKAVRKSLPRLGWKPGPEASLSFLPEAGHTAIAYIDGRTSTDSGFEIAEEKSRMEIDKATSRIRLAQEVLDEVFGLGPLEPLLADPTISDILVNTYKHVYIERKGMLEATSVQFRDDIHLMGIIDRIVSAIGRRVDESSPMVDVRLADGSRVNAIIPPLAVDGPCLSIRRFGRDPLTADDLLSNNSLTGPMLDLMRGCVKARLNVLISGGTGAGKTTFLNVLSSFISNRERIVTIEDAAELQLHQEHVVRLETPPLTSKAKAQFISASWSSTLFACAQTALSSVKSAARKRWTCCRR